jgi:tetratricopeptide (TPR) repeat protein
MLSRIAPTLLLLAGAAAAQPAPPPPPPAPDVYAAPRPARAPRPVLAADMAPPPQAPTPMPAPRPALAPMAPLPPMPPIAIDQDHLFEMQERAFEMQERAFELQDMKFKFDIDHKFDIEHKIASVNDSLSHLKFNMPFAFAPQQSPAARARMSDDNAYNSGQRALEGRRYTEALEYFNQVAARGGNRADGALYWKAYSLIKLSRADEARAAIAELRKSHPSSRWLDDAKALEVEAGKPVTPESESDEELKLIALNGLMQSDPDRAFPLLESLLKSAQPPRIRRQAVYVLAQSNAPKAQQLLEQVARGQGNPDLQLSAIRYLGEKRRQGGSNPVLAEIYGSSNDHNVKRTILSAFESARDKDRLIQIAKSEQDRDLRLHAIRMLGSIQGTQADLWALFQAESTPEGKQMILESIPSAGNLDKMVEVAKTEKDAKLRRYAINHLSNTRAATTGDALVQIYTNEQDQEVKRAIVNALANQKNVKLLIQCARSEKDNRMQQRILEQLVNMKSPEASEYLMEIIKK